VACLGQRLVRFDRIVEDTRMSYVGTGIPAMTNTRLVAGKGTFLDDVAAPGTTWMAVLRSPYAHARLRSIDTSEAERVPGVLYVITGKEIFENTEPIVEAFDTAAMEAKGVKWYALCHDKVRYVGECVAAVVAEDRFTAQEAVSLIDVDYEELPVVHDRDEAMQPDSPIIEEEWGDNLMVSRHIVLGDPDAAFAEADGVISGTVKSARIHGSPLEPRGLLASWDPHREFLTVWDSTQAPHPLRYYLAETLRMRETSIHVIQPDVGGGFGLKTPTFQEEPLACYLSIKLGRPVKWVEERAENLVVGGHARDTRFEYEAAYKSDGEITGIKLRVVADVGAPTALNGWGMSFVTWFCLPGAYRIPNSETELLTVVTNKGPWNAYRGYGKDAAAFVMDRIIDAVARVTGHSSPDVRFRNFIQPDQFPYPQASGAMLDSGNYPGALRQVLEMVGYEDFARLQEEARAEGRRIGLGLGQELTCEGCSMPGALALCGYDTTEVRVAPNGDVIVLTGVTSPGSGNETGIAQIVADGLGADLSRIRVVQGDTESCPYGSGNYSSRSVIMGGSAAYLAAEDIREKMLRIASRLLEVSEEDLDAGGSKVFVKGAPDRLVPFEEIAAQAYRFPHSAPMDDITPGLESTRVWKMPNVYHQPEKQGRFSAYPSWPNGSSACIVEVDEDTGQVKVLRYCLVHDAGTIINPLLADAQLHGGITQGLGGGIWEVVGYDEGCQPLTSTFMDYTVPTAVELPLFELGHQETPSPFTPNGTKGVGESGIGGTIGSLCSAVENAFPELEVRLTELPLTPERVWRAIQDAKERAGVADAVA
jgi:aerobic carbon-monoxide dehydrogenase large subunit